MERRAFVRSFPACSHRGKEYSRSCERIVLKSSFRCLPNWTRAMNRSSTLILIAAVPCLLCSCGLVTDAYHQSRLNSEYEREKNTYTCRFIDGKTVEYTKLGFGISCSPTNLVKTERKWDHGFRERYWQPNTYYESFDNEKGQYSLLIFAPDQIPARAAEKDYCGYALASLNEYFERFHMYRYVPETKREYEFGGCGWEIKKAEDRDGYDLPRNGKLWRLCHFRLTLANGQQMDFTLCHLKRDNWLYAFELVTPEPRRNDDFELMLAWMDSLYFLTSSSPSDVPQ